MAGAPTRKAYATVGTGVTNATATWDDASSTAAGEAIAVVVAYQNSSAIAVTDFRDQANNVISGFSQYAAEGGATLHNNGNGVTSQLWVLENAPAGIQGIKVTLASGPTLGGITVRASAHSGVATSGAVLKIAQLEQASPGTGADAITSGSTAAFASQDYYAYASSWLSGSTAQASGTGFTTLAQYDTGANLQKRDEYKNATGTSVAGTFTCNPGPSLAYTHVVAFALSVGAVLEAAAEDVASASAALTTEVKLAAAASNVTAASGALTTAIRLAMAAVVNAAGSGALTTDIPLTASAAGAASASALFAGGAVLQAVASDVVTATAALSTAVQLGGAAVDTALASGQLTNWAAVTLAGSLYTGQGGALDPNFWVDSVPALGTTLYYDATHIVIYPNAEISSDTNDCVAVVQFFDGASWATGLIVITSQLAAVARDVASASGQLTTAVQLAAAATALAEAAGGFSTGAGMAAAATDVAAASGALTSAIPLSALAQDVVTAVGALTSQIILLAAASGVASADASLNGVIVLNAAAAAVSAGLGALTTGIALGATAQGAATGVGSLTTAVQMSASAQDVANAIGSLTTAIGLGGAANDAVTASGDLTTVRHLVAAAIDAATAVAILGTGIQLTANASAISQASGALSSATQAMADATAQSTVTAVLTDVIDSPPIGAYVIDSRFVVSRSTSRYGTRRTPRFDWKHQLETAVLTFDVSDQLAPGETLTGRVTLQIACIAGMDASATAMFLGVPSYDTTRTKIMQPVYGGLEATYYLKASAKTTNPHKVVALAALLPVRT